MGNFKTLLEQVNELSEELAKYEDVQLKLDMLEGETDYQSWLEWIYNRIESEATLQDNINERKTALDARKKSSENRQQSLRNMALSILIAMGENKVRLPEFTVSRRKSPDKPSVVDDSFLPDNCIQVIKKPIMAEIKSMLEQGHKIRGVEWVAGNESVMFRK